MIISLKGLIVALAALVLVVLFYGIYSYFVQLEVPLWMLQYTFYSFMTAIFGFIFLGILAEMEIDWERVVNWITHFGLNVKNTHVSGHASGLQLKEFVEQVSPKTIIPIHTENANAFEKWSKNVILLQNVGETYNMG